MRFRERDGSRTRSLGYEPRMLPLHYPARFNGRSAKLQRLDLTDRVGLEPTTIRLTAERSTIELPIINDTGG